MIPRMAWPPRTGTVSISPVHSTTYCAYAFIEQFAQLGITNGCGTDAAGQKLYCPDRNVTRAEMAVFLTRAYP